MLVIRKEQLEALSRQRRQQFEERLLEHLKRVMPERCQDIGDDRLRAEIRYGIERATQYDITAERVVASYLVLMVRFGRDFEQSPARPWAQSILTDRTSSAENRLRRLQWRLRQA
jgi:hypothetical protein